MTDVSLNLIVPFYNEKNKIRRKEIIEAININASNLLFNSVMIILEDTIDIDDFNMNSRVFLIKVNERQRFLDLFKYFKKDSFNIICNNDIILEFQHYHDLSKTVFYLMRVQVTHRILGYLGKE